MVHRVLLTRPMLQTPRWKLAELRCCMALKRPESGEAMRSTWVTLTVHPLQHSCTCEVPKPSECPGGSWQCCTAV